jgi:hypothetical protein
MSVVALRKSGPGLRARVKWSLEALAHPKRTSAACKLYIACEAIRYFGERKAEAIEFYKQEFAKTVGNLLAEHERTGAVARGTIEQVSDGPTVSLSICGGGDRVDISAFVKHLEAEKVDPRKILAALEKSTRRNAPRFTWSATA